MTDQPSTGRTDVGALMEDLDYLVNPSGPLRYPIPRLRAALERIPALEERVETFYEYRDAMAQENDRLRTFLAAAQAERDALKEELKAIAEDLAPMQPADSVCELGKRLSQVAMMRLAAATKRAEDLDAGWKTASECLESQKQILDAERTRADALAARTTALEEIAVGAFKIANDGTYHKWARDKYAHLPPIPEDARLPELSALRAQRERERSESDARVRRKCWERFTALPFMDLLTTEQYEAAKVAILGPDAAPTEPGRGGGERIPTERCMEITYPMAVTLLDTFGGDEETILTIDHCNGHSGEGVYCWDGDYPDEGSVFLGSAAPQPPAAGEEEKC